MLEVRCPRDQRELEEALALRERVFCDEQGFSEEEDLDGLDDEALHLVASSGERLLGTCRLLFDGNTAKLGRMVVAADARRAGVGAALLREAEAQARSRGMGKLVLSAQLHARGLYARHGYRELGEIYLDGHVEHIWMERALA